MEKNLIVDSINKRLGVYGVNSYNEPVFRVVFSDDQTEKRNGVFNEYFGSIFVRQVRGVKEVQKYPWIKRKWILERWAPGELSYHPSLVTDKNGVYICVYVFQDANGNYLPPIWRAAEIVVKHLLNPRTKSRALAEDREQLEREEKEEVNRIVEELKIQSDEHSTKDSKSYRESASIGYTKEKI